jgi:hypothetical protein
VFVDAWLASQRAIHDGLKIDGVVGVDVPDNLLVEGHLAVIVPDPHKVRFLEEVVLFPILSFYEWLGPYDRFNALEEDVLDLSGILV